MQCLSGCRRRRTKRKRPCLVALRAHGAGAEPGLNSRRSCSKMYGSDRWDMGSGHGRLSSQAKGIPGRRKRPSRCQRPSRRKALWPRPSRASKEAVKMSAAFTSGGLMAQAFQGVERGRQDVSGLHVGRPYGPGRQDVRRPPRPRPRPPPRPPIWCLFKWSMGCAQRLDAVPTRCASSSR